ncbi:antigen LPMC-61-like [Zingiber officinale]|uniref:antigen LPMC-61-like n=1 Tax=Zingiber officinale TaxID=94328 RepID=UPI001C4B668C|nr:antigen LPMC-61-like [Zingiber officinale]
MTINLDTGQAYDPAPSTYSYDWGNYSTQYFQTQIPEQHGYFQSQGYQPQQQYENTQQQAIEHPQCYNSDWMDYKNFMYGGEKQQLIQSFSAYQMPQGFQDGSMSTWSHSVQQIDPVPWGTFQESTEEVHVPSPSEFQDLQDVIQQMQQQQETYI